MDFSLLPPEIISARMIAGPGAAPMLAAASAWAQLGRELTSAASACQSTLAGLTVDSWTGPSSINMAQSAGRYVTWLFSMATQAEQTAAQATAAAGAFQTASAATVPLALITANRSLYLTLVATNFFGQNSSAIAAVEAQYEQMWAQDVTMMHGYRAASQSAGQLTAFTQPPQVAASTPANALSAAQPLAGTAQAVAAPAQAVIDPSTVLTVLLDIPALTSTAASTTSSTFSGIAIQTTNHAVAVNAQRDDYQGIGPFIARTVTPPLGAIGGAPVVSAAAGRASLVSGLSVPQAWSATTASTLNLTPATLPAAPLASSASMSSAVSPGMFGEAMLGTLAGRGVNNAAAKARRSSVIPRSPAAG